MKKQCMVLFNREQRKVGFSVANFEELVRRVCITFEVNQRNIKLVLEDGTEVDDNDYFEYLPNDTVLRLEVKYDTSYSFWSKTKNLVCKMWSQPSLPKDALTVINDILSNKEMRQELQDILDRAEMNLKDFKQQDPDWFDGLPKNVDSKEDWMTQNSKNRIRGYFTRTKDEVEKLILQKSLKSSGDGDTIASFDDLFRKLRQELQKNEFHAGYFGRSSCDVRLCNSDGWFRCQGMYNTPDCLAGHRINPYGNRESRILFSTWNLDHVIERSRTVIPAIVEAIRQSHNKTINWKYFYNLLFVVQHAAASKKSKTVSNLKLVHIVCHVKASHKECTCDRNRYFIS